MDKKQIDKIIGVSIRARREELHMSQLAISQAAGHSSPAYIALIEAGKRSINGADLFLVCQALSISVDKLVSFKYIPELSPYTPQSNIMLCNNS